MGSNSSPSTPAKPAGTAMRSSGATAGKSASDMAKSLEKVNQDKKLNAEDKAKAKQGLFNDWTKPSASTLANQADLKSLNEAVDAEKAEQERIRKQQKAIVEAERARRSNISTATKRNTIRTGAQGINSTPRSMPSTIAGGTPGLNTIVGG